jgi:hypothetical protein
MILTAACQDIKTTPDILTPSFQHVNINPTETISIPTITNLPPYPGSNATSYPIQVPKSLPYPQPTLGVNPQPAATTILTPIPTVNQLPSVTAEPSISPYPEFTQSIQYFYPKCNPDGLYQKCSDDVLGIKYRYPSHWGYFSAELINGTCGGYIYSYRTGVITAMGRSLDYCKPIGGDQYTMFAGFQSGHGCDQFQEAKDCRQINDNVIIATLYPDFRSICDYGPGSIFTPVMVVGINIPGKRIVSAMAFWVNFLSIKGTDKLLEPFGGIITDTKKCDDPNTERVYSKLLDEISLKVKQGTFDEETSYKVKGILDFANSITFIP